MLVVLPLPSPATSRQRVAVYVIDGTEVKYSNVAEEDLKKTLSIYNVTMHMLSRGDRFDLIKRLAFDKLAKVQAHQEYWTVTIDIRTVERANAFDFHDPLAFQLHTRMHCQFSCRTEWLKAVS